MEAAEQFQQESGTAPGVDLATITDRMVIRQAVQGGQIEEAIDKVNDLNPEILEHQRELYFHLQQQRLIELIKLGDADGALTFAQVRRRRRPSVGEGPRRLTGAPARCRSTWRRTARRARSSSGSWSARWRCSPSTARGSPRSRTSSAPPTGTPPPASSTPRCSPPSARRRNPACPASSRCEPRRGSPALSPLTPPRRRTSPVSRRRRLPSHIRPAPESRAPSSSIVGRLVPLVRSLTGSRAPRVGADAGVGPAAAGRRAGGVPAHRPAHRGAEPQPRPRRPKRLRGRPGRGGHGLIPPRGGGRREGDEGGATERGGLARAGARRPRLPPGAGGRGEHATPTRRYDVDLHAHITRRISPGSFDAAARSRARSRPCRPSPPPPSTSALGYDDVGAGVGGVGPLPNRTPTGTAARLSGPSWS